MAQSWTLFVKGFDQKNMEIKIPGPHPECTKLSAFKTKIQEKTGLNPQYQLLKLVINKDANSMHSIYDDSKSFSDYPSITNGSQFALLLQSVTRHIDPLMKRSNGPCIVTYVEYETPECILAPCNHPIHPDDLMAYCQNEVFDQKKWEIRCMTTGCNVEWPLSFISKSGATTYEYELLEKGLSENHCIMNQSADIHQCPNCNCFCERIDKSQCRIRCWWCTKRSGKAYDFCWHCSSSWIGDHKCPQGEALSILEKAPEVEICGVRCPSTRACPKCNTLIEHMKWCAHMTCKMCKQKFCFICLRLEAGESWQCEPYKINCSPAQRQIRLRQSSNPPQPVMI